MAFVGLEPKKRTSQITEPAICYFCRSMIDGNALFCDICGHATLQSLQVKRVSLEAEIKEMERSVEKVNASRSELNSLNDRTKALKEGLQPLTVEVETLRNKKEQLTTETDALRIKRDELKNEAETLSIQVDQLGKLRKSEETSIDHLRQERLQLEQQVKNETKKIHIHRSSALRTARRSRKPKQAEHIFACEYEGDADWNAELSKLIAQFELTMDQTNYSASPEKIVFKVTGTPENIQKFAAAINGTNGFVNLRSRLAATRKRLRDGINERDIHNEQLHSMNRLPWYRANRRTLKNQKNELDQKIAEDEARIKAITEDLKALEELFATN